MSLPTDQQETKLEAKLRNLITLQREAQETYDTTSTRIPEIERELEALKAELSRTKRNQTEALSELSRAQTEIDQTQTTLDRVRTHKQTILRIKELADKLTPEDRAAVFRNT